MDAVRIFPSGRVTLAGAVLVAAAALLPSARSLEATPHWDAARGAYVSGCENHLSIWRMRGGVPVELTRYELSWPSQVVPARTEEVSEQVEVSPGVFETRTRSVVVAPASERSDWSRGWIFVTRLRPGPPPRPPPAPAPAPAPAGGAACGSGGQACGK